MPRQTNVMEEQTFMFLQFFLLLYFPCSMYFLQGGKGGRGGFSVRINSEPPLKFGIPYIGISVTNCHRGSQIQTSASLYTVHMFKKSLPILFSIIVSYYVKLAKTSWTDSISLKDTVMHVNSHRARSDNELYIYSS